mgnify:FL=1|tara:strand:+ start:766 stop:999 length:234 start_codon:yes stop_codon:yes gene_type:complete
MAEKMVCGGIYEITEETGRVKQASLIALTIEPNGPTMGTLMFSGYAPEYLNEDSERWGQFKLIGRPASPKVGRPKKG